MAEEKTEALTPAEAELRQQDDDEGRDLKAEAREEKAQQKAGLAAGKGVPTGDSAVIDGTPPQQRSRNPDAKPIGGTVDNMSRREGNEPHLGHMVLIDYSKKSVVKAVKDQLAPKGSALEEQGFEPGVGSADYGAYYAVGDVDDEGYPVSIVVYLRDEHAAMVNVPADAVRAAPVGGRR